MKTELAGRLGFALALLVTALALAPGCAPKASADALQVTYYSLPG